MSASAGPVPAPRTFPVSVKGVAVQAGKVLLLENERAEWELPGGKLELGEGYKRSIAAWWAALGAEAKQRLVLDEKRELPDGPHGPPGSNQ